MWQTPLSVDLCGSVHRICAVGTVVSVIRVLRILAFEVLHSDAVLKYYPGYSPDVWGF